MMIGLMKGEFYINNKVKSNFWLVFYLKNRLIIK